MYGLPQRRHEGSKNVNENRNTWPDNAAADAAVHVHAPAAGNASGDDYHDHVVHRQPAGARIKHDAELRSTVVQLLENGTKPEDIKACIKADRHCTATEKRRILDALHI